MNAHQTHTHEAMKTTFTFRIQSDQADFAGRLAANVFEELDAIEQKLSRYFPGSDVWQINHLQAGEKLFISETTYECLRIAFDIFVETGGLFDVTLGRKIEHQKNEIDGPSPDITGQLMLDPDHPVIHCVEAGREIDLGGIGKGFALDLMSERLRSEGIESGLLSAGASTHLAFGSSSWPIHLSGCPDKEKIDLKNQALSASGTEIQGSHLISPSGDSRVYPYSQVWVVEKTAARADAWSTAAMLLSREELEEVRQKRPVYTACTRQEIQQKKE